MLFYYIYIYKDVFPLKKSLNFVCHCQIHSSFSRVSPLSKTKTRYLIIKITTGYHVFYVISLHMLPKLQATYIVILPIDN